MTKSKPRRYELGLPLDAELEDLSEGYLGAPTTRLVREAVQEFIERRLAEEPVVRKRYEVARKDRLKLKDTKLSVVSDDD